MSSQSSISLKNQSIRKEFRRKEIASYMKNVREKILKSRMKQKEVEELNAKVLQMVEKEDLEGLYECLYRNNRKGQNQDEVPCSHLNLQNIEKLVTFLMKKVTIVKSLLILYNLFELHYKTIFLNPNQFHKCQGIVGVLYEQANSAILAFNSNTYKSPENPNSHINCLLNCIKSLIFNKEESQNEFTFTEVVRKDYLINYIYSWAQMLIANPLYLMILVIIESDMNISSMEPMKSVLNSDPKLMLKLLHQSNPNNNIFKSNSLPSIILANIFLSNIEDKQMIQQLIQPFLETSKVVYQFGQSAKKEFYRIKTLLQTFESCITIFQKLEHIALKDCLCQHLSNANYYTFSIIILRSQCYIVRQKIVRLMQHALNNLLICRAPLQDFMTETLVGSLGEGIEGKCIDIIIPSLKCFISIYTFIEEHPEKSQNLRTWIHNFDIETNLEDMVYHPSKQIKSLSSFLIEKMQSVQKGHKGDMDLELI